MFVGTMAPGGIWITPRLRLDHGTVPNQLVQGEYVLDGYPKVEARNWPHPNAAAIGTFSRGDMVKVLDVCWYPAAGSVSDIWVWAMVASSKLLEPVEFEAHAAFENCNAVTHWDRIISVSGERPETR